MYMNCPVCGNSNHDIIYQLYDDRYGYDGLFEINKCKNCRHGALDLQFTDNDIANLYTEYYPRNLHNLENRPVIKHCQSKFQAWLNGINANAYRWIPKNVSILDIGCGYGEAVGYHMARGCEAYGVEADSNVINVKEKYNYNIHIGSFDDKEYEADYFDYVTMDQVIEHLQDPVNQIRNIHRILKPGGMLIMSTPNSNSLTAKIFRRKWLHWHVPYHLHFFSKKSIKLLADSAGFKLIKCKSITEYTWLRMQFIHLLNFPLKGEPSSYWCENQIHNKPFNARSISSKLIDYLTKYKIIHIANKLFDLSGIGDNYVIILMKK